jgi:hypothetical protein
MARHLEDLGPDFDRRWKQAPQPRRRELIAELRDLYLMLGPAAPRRGKKSDAPGTAPAETSLPLLPPEGADKIEQGSLFDAAAAAPAPAEPPAEPPRENPFLPRSVLARLQESQSRANAGLRDLIQNTEEQAGRRANAEFGSGLTRQPSHEQSDLERELRLKLGPLVESLIEAQMEILKNELRVRLRLEMDRLIAEHVRSK